MDSSDPSLFVFILWCNLLPHCTRVGAHDQQNKAEVMLCTGQFRLLINNNNETNKQNKENMASVLLTLSDKDHLLRGKLCNEHYVEKLTQQETGVSCLQLCEWAWNQVFQSQRS